MYVDLVKMITTVSERFFMSWTFYSNALCALIHLILITNLNYDLIMPIFQITLRFTYLYVFYISICRIISWV